MALECKRWCDATHELSSSHECISGFHHYFNIAVVIICFGEARFGKRRKEGEKMTWVKRGRAGGGKNGGRKDWSVRCNVFGCQLIEMVCAVCIDDGDDDDDDDDDDE